MAIRAWLEHARARRKETSRLCREDVEDGGRRKVVAGVGDGNGDGGWRGDGAMDWLGNTFRQYPR